MSNEPQFKELNGQIKFHSPAKMTKGDTFIGKYIEDKTMGEYQTLVHLFEGEEGTFGLNSTGQLRYLLGQVTPGSLVKLTYIGRSTNPKFAKNSPDKIPHEFKIGVAKYAAATPPVAPKTEAKPAAAPSSGALDPIDF